MFKRLLQPIAELLLRLSDSKAPRWYSSQEIREYLSRINCPDDTANNLSVTYAENLQRAFNKGYDMARRPAMENYLDRHRVWSVRTFGEGLRTRGITNHIRKELLEIEADPRDMDEWLDVVILALDGAWRSGATTHSILQGLERLQRRNFSRRYPRPTSQDEPSEHIR